LKGRKNGEDGLSWVAGKLGEWRKWVISFL